MNLTIFAKRRTAQDGRTFFTYLTTLTKKDGTEKTVAVKFRETAGTPENFPCNIIVEKCAANLSKKTYIANADGEIAESYTLWITKWAPGAPYEDHSLDEYEW